MRVKLLWINMKQMALIIQCQETGTYKAPVGRLVSLRHRIGGNGSLVQHTMAILKMVPVEKIVNEAAILEEPPLSGDHIYKNLFKDGVCRSS